MTVAEWLDRWLAASGPAVSERTRDRHEWAVRVWLRPAFGRLRLDKLTPEAVERGLAA
ncbi:MAG: site-specific integrase, partial [Propionibacteriaceae bacterium]|nr:site-specific integrase [Propionibacteriaceae bacterium]